MKKINLHSVAVCGAVTALTCLSAFAADLSYTAGDTDLDGKVVITYDTSETAKVKTIVATPSGGETLTITGAAMTFAAGATISLAADGKLIFANDVTADGALALNRTDGAYYDWTGSKGDPLPDYYYNWNNAGVWKYLSTSFTRINYPDLNYGGVKMWCDDWELIGLYAFADVTPDRPISKNSKQQIVTSKYPDFETETSDDKHGTWTYSNLGGAYTRVSAGQRYLDWESDGSQNRWYVFNRWTGEYTYSVRVLMTGWNDGEFHLIARTAVRGPKYGRYPDTNFWQDQSVVTTNDWTGWYGNGNELSDMSGTYKGTPDYLGINRAIFRKYGSDVATVGFSGDVSLSGQTDIALGVKLAVLPKENSTFAAPIFSGEGDVEYQRNAILANANLLKYASELSVTNATIEVTQSGAFPVNAVVNIWNGGVVNVNWGNSPAYSDGVSGDWYDLNVHEGGRFQTQGGSSYTDGGVGAHTCTEVDGGTLCIGDPEEYRGSCDINYLTLANGAVVTGNFVRVGNNANLTPLLNVVGSIASTIGCNLDMAGVGTDPKFIFNVADIPDVADDCVMNKDIKVRNGNFDDYGFSFIKSGAGTLKMNGTIYSPTKVEGGALVFGATGGMSTANNDIELSGATLGKVSGVFQAGTLAVGTEGGTLELGPNAIMIFADSSAKTWSGTLIVKGYRDNAIKFGNSKEALSATQQASIKTVDGKKLHLTSNGYLAIPGCVIIVR